MPCVAALARLTFTDHLPLLDVRRAVCNIVLGGTVPDEDRPATALADKPILVDVASERTRVIVHGHGWAVTHELAESPARYVDALAAQFARAYPAFDGLALESATLNSAWIEPVQTGWADLLRRYREAFMTDYELSRQASDLSQSFDFAGEGFSGKAQTGPMQQEQLVREYLNFGGDETLPEHFLFADIAYEAPSDQSSQPENLREFLARGMAHGERMAGALSTQFRRGGAE